MLKPERRGFPRLGPLEPLQKWGGAECTVNRVGNDFIDQLKETGHHERESDIALLAELGIQRIRFPMLWERIAPRFGRVPDWSWTDRRLELLRKFSIDPIAGLLHHGSGPAHTSLVDDDFPEKFAGFAGEAVARYPWIIDWTPINEPLTTARFSALYGLWYPHARDERTFWTAQLNQIDGIRLAMQAIRKVQPGARLIQTEDLGRTYATEGLADQAAFDNERRWVTWDLLCGMVGPGHPLWPRLCDFGFGPRLRAIHDDPCPPDVIGIDHYLTSDRLLDERVDRYPPATRGGNATTPYSDVEALRVLTPPPRGLQGALKDAWQRYGLPIAITEVHNGCSREEQVRWFDEAWSTAQRLRADGVDVRAVTAWALFGNRGWSTLLTAKGEYECGAFDVSSGSPRPTALADAIRWPGQPRNCPGSGWWQRDQRLEYPAAARPAPIAEYVAAGTASCLDRRCPILIVGATGTLGRAFARECLQRDLSYQITDRNTLNILDDGSINAVLEDIRPWAVINAAGWVRVDEAESEPEACRAVNEVGSISLARACAERSISTLSFSSDLVFDGTANRAYLEHDEPAPLNVYGHSKAALEAALASLPGKHLTIRTAAFFSPFDRHNFAVHCVERLQGGEVFEAASDCIVSPTYVPDLCRSALDLLLDGETGIWHLTNGEGVTWLEFAHRLAAAAGLGQGSLVGRSHLEMQWRARRPASVPLASARGHLLPTLESAITRFTQDQARTKATFTPRAA